MDKKKLSIVMAGAMLATTVAPVLAAPVEYGTSQKKLVEKEVTDLVESGKISSSDVLKDSAFTTGLASLMDGKHSIYGIKVLDKDGKAINLNASDILGGTGNGFDIKADKLVDGTNNTLTYDIDSIKSILKDKDLVADMTVQIVEMEHSKFLGQIIPGTEIRSVGGVKKYEVKDFSDAEISKLANTSAGTNSPFVKEIKANETKTGATIVLNTIKDLSAVNEEYITIELDINSDKLNFDLPLDKEGNLVVDNTRLQDCVGFAKKEKYQTSMAINTDPKVKSEYKLVDDSEKAEQVTYLAKDLYDGLALTAKGTEIQTDIDNAKKLSEETGNALTVELSPEPVDLTNGIVSFTVTYFASHKDNVSNAKDDKPSKIVTIKSTSLKEIQSLHRMLKRGDYEVGIIAGNNRYETAVNVAKRQGLTMLDKDATVNNIVLVNGKSLVDGLSAAPLAVNLGAYQANKGGSVDVKKSSPLLLTETDSLPKATKDYLVELTNEIAPKDLKKVKINLVGGESVLSKSLVDELKGMGFTVERFGGENREETSLEVARELVSSGNDDRIFVVGANGEADAMSIASIASQKTYQTPILVAKAGGMSKDAVKFIKNNYNAKIDNVVVIGGESVVSKEEYDKLDSVVENKVDRISGKNRFETNAAIIDKYASNIEEVILVKDGQNDKNELIDALSAANYAAGNPIVLATDKITDAQKIAILNKKHPSKPFAKLTQVGQGVARTTLETVANFLDLSNVK